MILYGKNITAKDDMLQKMPLTYIYNQLREPQADVNAKIRQLRIIRTMDTKQYAFLKKQLPYFVCGIFHPPYRRIENFGYTEYFIVDIDHISEKDMSISEIRNKVQQDERVRMCFVSPGEDGLKILFKLSERCYDAAIYSVFYKAFIRSFAQHYHFEQVVDTKTSDVARACFISVDEQVYANVDAATINLKSFIDTENLSAFLSLKKELEKESKPEQSTKEKQEEKTENNNTNEPDVEAIQKIKSILNPKANQNLNKPPVYVPDELENIMNALTVYVTKAGVQLIEIVNIQYGKKLKFTLGLQHAEINLFYGKKGFSVVKSPRSGTNQDLNDLMSDLIQTFLYELI